MFCIVTHWFVLFYVSVELLFFRVYMSQVYDDSVAALVAGCFQGYNATVLAFGQTVHICKHKDAQIHTYHIIPPVYISRLYHMSACLMHLHILAHLQTHTNNHKLHRTVCLYILGRIPSVGECVSHKYAYSCYLDV